MIMKYFTLVSIALALSLFPLRAEKVDAVKAGMMAQRHLQSKRQFASDDAVKLKYAATQRHKMSRSGVAPHDVQDTVFYYVFNIDEKAGGGFVIISGDDAVTPILGYSDSGSYDEERLPPNFAYWMDCLQEEIRYVMSQNLPQSDLVRQEWDGYMDGGIVRLAVSPLLTTRWDQEAPYSDLCPMYNGSRTATGCVATAMAQIMYYHRYPARGVGQSAAYRTETTNINIPSVNFEVNYNWNNMLNSYSSGSPTSQQRTAVATLMYHCGVSVQMDYGPASSAGSFDVLEAMTYHFDYDKSMLIKYRNFYANAAWDEMLKAQIDAGLPVYYRGEGSAGGHAFVCDGYDNSGRFHFNWGWGGSYNGYFVSSSLNPGSGSTLLNQNQRIIVDIKPNAGGTVPYDLILYNRFSTFVSSVQSNELFTVTATVGNVGEARFPGGFLGVALVNNSGQIVEIIGSNTLSAINADYSGGLSLISCRIPGSVVSGQYTLRAVFRTTGGSWNLITGASGCPVSINIRVEQVVISPDPYEPNDTPAEAYALPVTFIDDVATVKTTGSNIHIETDVDYYKTVLPSGYNYTITARLHDSYKSADGNTYTVDARFYYSTDGNNWSDWYDDVMYDDIIFVPDGGTVYFLVEPYFSYGTGSYLLDIRIERAERLATYTVAFNTQGGSAVPSQTIALGGMATQPANPARVGYTFNGWFSDEARENAWNFEADAVTDDITLYAKWTINAYSVAFDTKDNSAIPPQTIEYGGRATQPANPARDGYTFGGWFSDEARENAWNFETDAVTDDITLYAKWTLNTYTVAFDTQGGSAIPPQTKEHGGMATQPADPQREGYTFGGWFKEAACINVWNFSATAVNSNVVIYAKWTKIVVTGVETPDAPLVRIYPNPTYGAVTLEFETTGAYHITLADMTGRVLLRQTTADRIVRIDLGDYPAGVYLLTIDDGKRQNATRVSKIQ